METRQKRKKIIFGGLVLLCAATAVFCAYKIVVTQKNYAVASREYEGLAERYLTPTATGVAQQQNPEKELDFDALRALNPDFIGWLEIPGTRLNYPLVQTLDNDYYIDHTFEKTYNASGAVFMDMHNKADFTSANTILYGHNMKDGSMFGMLEEYFDADFLAQHPEILLRTKDDVLVYKIFAVRQTTIEDAGYQLYFSDEEQYQRFAESFGASVPIWPMITLSTCTNGEEDGRYLVQAVLQNPTEPQQKPTYSG